MMILAPTLAVMTGVLLAGAASMRPTENDAVVPAASSNAHRPDAYGNYGGLKRGYALPAPRAGGVPANRPPRQYPDADAARRQPYPYQYYQDSQRGNYGCDWLARRAIDTNNLNWWTRYRSCSRNKTNLPDPSHSR